MENKISTPENQNITGLANRHGRFWQWFLQILALIIVVLGLIYFYRWQRQENSEKVSPKPNLQVVSVSSTSSPNKLPAGFLAELPLEKEEAIIKSQISTLSNGKTKAEIIFQTTKTPEEGYLFYRDYFVKNRKDWTVLNLEQNKAITATNPLKQIYVEISFDENAGETAIGISAIYLP